MELQLEPMQQVELELKRAARGLLPLNKQKQTA